MMLHRRICMWLRSRGTPFRLDQFSTGHEGVGPEVILRWDETLGRRPTQADLAPFDPELETMALQVRLTRDRLLFECDWTMLPDAQRVLGEPAFLKWVAYRQALRDVTEQAHFPRRVLWPDPPA